MSSVVSNSDSQIRSRQLRSSGPLTSFTPMTTQPTTVEPRKPRSLFIDWMIAGTATMSACLFTNPAEVIKTRMQLQNELAARTPTGQPPVLYRNIFQGFVHVSRTEGIRGLQGGLGPSLLYQLTMNGTRLGLYDPCKRMIRSLTGTPSDEIRLGGHRQAHVPPLFWHNVAAAATSGAIAAFIGSPFFLVKVRLQVQANMKSSAAALSTVSPSAGPTVVGAQHNYTSAWGGLRSIYKADGVRGLFRGANASIVRVVTGGTVQLSTYDTTKHEVMKLTGWGEGVPLHFSASLLSGFLVAVAMNPPDVISTRLYNQPVVNGRGQLYNGWLDCARKTLAAEGVRGYYKGFLAHYLRVGPHTLLTFIFWEKLKSVANKAGI